MKMIHSMIRVLDLGKSMDFYGKALALEVAARFDFDGFTLVYMRHESSEFELELTHNHDRKEPYDLGSGYGHIAVSVAGIEEDHERLSKLGLEVAPTPIKEFMRDGKLMAKFFFLVDPDGYKVEVLQRHGRYL